MISKMTKHLLVIAAILALGITTATADENTDSTKWSTSLVADFTTTQTSYSDSWTGGEAGSVNWVSNVNGSAEKQLKRWLNFKSTLKLSFGQTMTQNVDLPDKPWKKPKKSTDLIDWENVGRFTEGWVVDPYAAFRAETRFFDGSVEAHKCWLSPLKLTESVGFARRFYEKDKDFVSSRLGLGVRQILTKVFTDTVDYATETESATDGGFESVTDVELTLNDNLKYTGKLTLYKAAYYSKKDDVAGTVAEDYWKSVDVNWENIITASISKIISVNLYSQLLYDREVSAKGQLKETLAIGFVFKMI